MFTSVESDLLPITSNNQLPAVPFMAQISTASQVVQPSPAEMTEARHVFNMMAMVTFSSCVFPDGQLHPDIRLLGEVQAQVPRVNEARQTPGSQMTAQRSQVSNRPDPLERIALSRRPQATSQPPRPTQQLPDLAALGVASSDFTEDLRSNLNYRLASIGLPHVAIPFDFRAALPQPFAHEAWNREVRLAAQRDPTKTFQQVEGGMLVLIHSVKKNPNICRKECLICREGLDGGDLGDPAGVDQCCHWFHKGCILNWLHQKATCPSCRIPVKELLVADQAAEVESPRMYDSNRNSRVGFQTPRRTRDQRDYDTPHEEVGARGIEEIMREHERRLLGR